MPTELKPTFQAKSNTATNNTATCCRKTFIAMQIIKEPILYRHNASYPSAKFYFAKTKYMGDDTDRNVYSEYQYNN